MLSSGVVLVSGCWVLAFVILLFLALTVVIYCIRKDRKGGEVRYAAGVLLKSRIRIQLCSWQVSCSLRNC